jgi:riboflavin synthase
VNLESSLRVGSKIGGHFVTGHIDGIATLIESISTAQAWEMRFGVARGFETQWQQNIVPYLVDKGSITINGISLTIAESDSDNCWFKAAVIPHTYAETNLSCLKAGDLVNVEADILGKYVARLVNHHRGHDSTEEAVTLDFLAENGYV